MIPRGFVQEKSGNRLVYLLEERAEELRELGFVDGAPTQEPVASSEGRTQHPIFEIPEERRRVLWKHCLRGGAMEKLLKDRHWRIDRFLRELETSHDAIDAGVRVAETIGLAVVTTATGWKRIEMVSTVVDGASDFAESLMEHTPTERRAILTAVAEELRRFHGLGFTHGDLNVKNLLWRRSGSGAVEVTLIDLDPGAWRVLSDRVAPEHNLMRLFRSAVKGELKQRWQLHATELLRFLHVYFRGDRRSMREFWHRAAKRRRGWLRFRFRRPGVREGSNS